MCVTGQLSFRLRELRAGNTLTAPASLPGGVGAGSSSRYQASGVKQHLADPTGAAPAHLHGVTSLNNRRVNNKPFPLTHLKTTPGVGVNDSPSLGSYSPPSGHSFSDSANSLHNSLNSGLLGHLGLIRVIRVIRPTLYTTV